MLPFLIVMTCMLAGISRGIWSACLLSPVAAALLVRLFMFQHDCGHGSFFRSRAANDHLGRMLGVLTLTPYACWRADHAAHHAHAGNLDRRGTGDVTTLTLSEYRALPRLRRLAYRLYRHPLIMFGVGPAWLFLLRQRVPASGRRARRQAWTSALGTDAAIAASVIGLALVFGPYAVLLGWLPVTLIAATAGVWLFYVQHQFEDAYWERRADWNFHVAALEGASFYDLPPILRWVSGNIGFHHIHHLACRIPNYRLRECHQSDAAFRGAPRLTARDSLRCIRLALWDDEERKLVGFGQSGPAR